MNSFFSDQELKDLGLKSYGTNVLISRKSSLYNPEKMALGDNVRIDDYCILSGAIEVGSYVHISAFCALYGGGGIKINDHSGLSPRCSLFSHSDDFSGICAIGPMYRDEDRNIVSMPILIDKYSQVGSGSVILPGIKVPEGFSCGAMTLLNKDDLKPWSIYVGSPARKIGNRSGKVKKIISRAYDKY